MKKEAYKLEYIFPKVSIPRMWRRISTELGLKAWIMGEVSINAKRQVSFVWEDGEHMTAQMEVVVPERKVRYHWTSGATGYFELEISPSELTGDKLLTITDFAEPQDLDSSRELWDIQVQKLRSIMGIRDH